MGRPNNRPIQRVLEGDIDEEIAAQWAESVTWGCLLHKDGIQDNLVNVCSTCLEQLRRQKACVPARVMANDLWTGKKQALSELTQIERAVCSRVRTYNNVVQLYFHGSGGPHQRGITGNTICFNNNVPVEVTGKETPAPIADLQDMLQVVLVGHKKSDNDRLRKHFAVRRDACRTASETLCRLHPGWAQLSVSEKNLQEYPVNDLPAAFTDGAVHLGHEDMPMPDENNMKNPFSAGTTEGDVVLQATGVMDVNGTSITEHDILNHIQNSAEERRAKSHGSRRSGNEPVHVTHDKQPLVEWGNPKIWHEAFFELFPLGTGGAELPNRPTELSLHDWIAHWLSVGDPRFRNHETLMFVAANMLYRWAILSATRLMLKRKRFQQVAAYKVTADEVLEALQLMKGERTLAPMPSPFCSAPRLANRKGKRPQRPK